MVSHTTVESHYIRDMVRNGIVDFFDDRLTATAFLTFSSVILLGIFGPMLLTSEPDTIHYAADGSLLRLEPPSLQHPLGTTSNGYDVFTRLVYGARPTALTGLVGGTIIVTIGTFVGVTSGYVGGVVDDAFMRFTDFVYGVPLIPFAIVLAAFLGTGFWTSVMVIGLILWRGPARVLRSQVLQIKERPFIMATQALGGSTPRVIIRHILPNIASMAILFFAIGIGDAIIIQAGLAFVGVSSPFVPSWGIMIRNAYTSGVMADAWWWSFPPGILISITVLSAFLLGRSYETQTHVGGGSK